MSQRIIRFCYRKIIDASSVKQWDKFVFESSYTEFLMQSQFYNQEKKYTGFSELLLNVPGADNLHFLVSASVTGYMQQLNGQVPDIINNLGKLFLKFKGFRFEMINSDIKDKSKHQVAINFFTEPMMWHNTIDNYLLLSSQSSEATADGVLTHLVQLQSFFSIYSFKEEKQ
ncbi:MAG: hypothetical protein ABUT20_39500 [Bacteroidota bacterium]